MALTDETRSLARAMSILRETAATGHSERMYPGEARAVVNVIERALMAAYLTRDKLDDNNPVAAAHTLQGVINALREAM